MHSNALSLTNGTLGNRSIVREFLCQYFPLFLLTSILHWNLVQFLDKVYKLIVAFTKGVLIGRSAFSADFYIVISFRLFSHAFCFRKLDNSEVH